MIILGEDVGPRGGVFGVTDGFYKQFGADRVIDTPLAESSIAGIALGAAVAGLIPVAEIQFADFIHPAMNQIINEIAKIRYRSNNDWHVPAGDPRPLWRRHPRRALPLAVGRGASSAISPGLMRGHPLQPLRRQGPAQGGHPPPRPGALLRAQGRVPADQGRGAGGRLYRRTGQAAKSPAKAAI